MATATFPSILPRLMPFRFPATIERLLGRALGISEIEEIYAALCQEDNARSITDRLLDFLGVTYTASEIDLLRVPQSGPAILTANHPFGILEGAVLASMLRRIRRDVRFLANSILTVIPELRELIIPVDPISGRGNHRGLRRSLEHLSRGGMLVVFPAGEVSHFRWQDRAVTDADWNPAVARMAQIAGAPVLPAFVAGANGFLFQLAGAVHPRLRTVLLGRELLNKRGHCVEVRVGAPIPPDRLEAISDPRKQAEYLRWRTYLLAHREPFHAKTALRPAARPTTGLPIAPAIPAEELAAEIAALPAECLLNRSGDLEVYLARALDIPNVLHELGRLREITFRAAGEGTGTALDRDAFDEQYLHLFVWNARKQELVGAYRLAQTDVVRDLYTATLFRYDQRFLDKLGPALELGRSFVRQEYQKGFVPLLLLWKGIGAFLARNPRYKTLFGPVSISNQYEAISRELMVTFLEKYASMREWAGLVRNRNGFRGGLLKGVHRPVFPDAGFGVEELSQVVGEIEGERSGVPVLLRQYLKLGGKLLGFNVDPKFANALDGLILVDLTKTSPKLLERYLGKDEAQTFLEFQGRTKCNTLELS
jgi:putative hemolysin